MARSNGDLVAKARQLTEDVGRRAATVAQAREILGVARLGRLDAGHMSQVAGLDAPRR
jgi:hypothetical protein